MTVLPPPRTPPTYSLFRSAIRPQGEGEERWELQGLRYRPEACDIGGVYGTCPPEEATGKLVDLNDNPDFVQATPYWVWAGASCVTASQDRVRSLPSEALRALQARESYYTAREFELGALTQELESEAENRNVYLANGNASAIASAALSPPDALACLEKAMGQCGVGEEGMIHAPRDIVTLWFSYNLIVSDGRLVRTKLGTIVVPDAGYSGSGGEAGSSRVYGTSPVVLRTTEPDTLPKSLNEAVNRDSNKATYRTERLVAVTFDPCCHLSVDVEAPECDLPVAS